MLPSVLTLLPVVRLNSLKMCPTTSQAEQLRALALSTSLMKCRMALLTCQESIVGLIFLLRRQREATCSLGQPFGHEQRQQEQRRSLGSSGEGQALAPGCALSMHSTGTCPLHSVCSPHRSHHDHVVAAQSTSLGTPALPVLAAASPPRQRFPFPRQLTCTLGSLHRHCAASTTWGSFSVIMGSARDAQKHAWRHSPDGKRDPWKSRPVVLTIRASQSSEQTQGCHASSLPVSAQL